MGARPPADVWTDDEPLPLPASKPGDDESNFAPDDDSDLGLDSAELAGGLDDSEGLDEPPEAELALTAPEQTRWTEGSEAAADLEGTEEELPEGDSEYGWTTDNEPGGEDDLADETLGEELRESEEDSGDEGLGDDEDLGEAMELPPLRSGGTAEPDEEGIDVQPLDGDALPDERRVQVLGSESWTLLPEASVRRERAATRPLSPPCRTLLVGEGAWLSIREDGLLCVGTKSEPAQRVLPEVGPALSLAGGGRRVAVLAREPSGRARLSLSLDSGHSFQRLKLPGTGFPRQVLMLGATLLVVLPEEGAFVLKGEAFEPVLGGEIHGACLVLEDDETRLYAHLRTPGGSWLVRRDLGSHARAPQAVLELGTEAPLELTGSHDAGQTRLELTGEAAVWTVWIDGEGSFPP